MQDVVNEALAAAEAGVGLSVCTGVACVLARVNPFYRRELRQEDKNRLTPLDGLRGVLCFLVMFHHAALTRAFLQFGVWLWVWPASRIATLMGSGAVTLFFCTTGFLFWSRALATRGKIDALPFLRARVFRIAPAYLLSVLLVAALAAPLFISHPRQALESLARMSTLGFLDWWRDGGLNLIRYNAGVQWSLAFEWAFYLALPVLALSAVEGRGWTMALLTLAMLRVTGWGVWIFFLPGIIAAYLAGIPGFVAQMRRPWMSVLVLLAMAAFPCATGDPSGLRALVFCALIFIPIACGNDLFGLLQISGLRLMGIVSYSVYLLHGSFLYVAHPLLRSILNNPHHPVITYWACIWSLAVIVLLACAASYRFIEWPAIQFEKRMRAQRSTDTIVRHREEAALQVG